MSRRPGTEGGAAVMLKSVSIIAVLLASVMPAKASGDYTSSAKSIFDDDAVEAICLSRYFPIDFSGNCVPNCFHTHALRMALVHHANSRSIITTALPILVRKIWQCGPPDTA